MSDIPAKTHILRERTLADRYRLIREIGKGGMSTVYYAYDTRMERYVAVKVLDQYVSRTPGFQRRFLAEIRNLSRINHPNILIVHDSSELDSEELWLVTEYLDGQTLEDFFHVNSCTLHPLVATFIICEISKALEEIHEHKIIHRDIKPSNIMILKNGKIKLLDFGISKDIADLDRTVTNAVLGTPNFMSPEQIKCEKIDYRTDIYSLSVIYYYLLTNDFPFKYDTDLAFFMDNYQINSVSTKKASPNVPNYIDKIVTKGISRDRSQRLSSISRLRMRLEAIIEDYGFDSSDIELKRLLKYPKKYQFRLHAKCSNISSAKQTKNSKKTNENSLVSKTTARPKKEIQNKKTESNRRTTRTHQSTYYDKDKTMILSKKPKKKKPRRK